MMGTPGFEPRSSGLEPPILSQVILHPLGLLLVQEGFKKLVVLGLTKEVVWENACSSCTVGVVLLVRIGILG